MVTLFGLLLTAGGVATAAWLVAARRKVAAAFGDSRTALAFVAFAVLANAAPVLAGDRSSALIGLLVLALLAWAVRSGRRSLRGSPDRWLRISWWSIAALLLWCLAVDALVGSGLYGPRLVAYTAAGLLLLAGVLLAAGTALSVRALAYTGLAVLSVMTIPTVFFDQAWRTCTAGKLEKCSVAGALFKSFFESENYIAMIATFTLVAGLCALRRAELLATTAFCLLIIVATGSRTSYLALAAAGAWLAGSYLIERGRRFTRIHLALCLTVVLTFLTAATYLMWTADRTTLSNRGNIWIHAREYLADMKATGVGVSKWYYLRDVGEAPTHFFHSGYVLAIFAGGFVALAIWGLWATALLRGAVSDGRAFTGKAPVVLLLVYSVTEVVWNPLSVDGLSWIAIALMLTRSVAAPAGALPAPGPVDAVDRPGGLAALRRLTSRHGGRRTTAGA
ncbi:O-antigen ligase like membrane protein [Micromonospora purpureochromogenes]|uniref:O-antigen ligase like membrane protein n=1 Tax=Micromonospora purpureochromogenes TaxID=47872 RepID=A0A1C5A731_9ACTN|nr:O-antigen ligase family protein [Micromonospora purpureochromogenes]SCF40814.1 O-antigen ligase like membrane protein [Micromonospora purpureochromogenes]